MRSRAVLRGRSPGAPLSRFPTMLETILIPEGNIAVFRWANSLPSLGRLISAPIPPQSPLSPKFPFSDFREFGDMITTDVKILQYRASNSNPPIDCQNILLRLSTAPLFPGRKGKKATFRFLIFAPPGAQIVLSGEWFLSGSRTSGRCSSAVGPMYPIWPMRSPLFFRSLPPVSPPPPPMFF